MDAPDSNAGSIAKFNPGQLKNLRLHALLEGANMVRLTAKARNADYGYEYNYVLWKTYIDTLFTEVWPKLGKDEKEYLLKFQEDYERLMVEHPVVIQDKKTGNDKWMDEVWRVHKKSLEKYEREVRTAADKHGLDTPDRDDPRSAVIQT